MPTLTTPALVLRRADYRDYDRMVTLFTPQHGRIDASARGCRRAKSPLLNASEPFVSGEFLLSVRNDRYLIQQCQIHESFYDLRKDYDRLLHGAYWLRLLDQAIVSDVPAEEIFFMSLKALAHLNYASYPPPLLTLGFEAHLTYLSGYAPQMDACVACGRKIDGPARFDARKGGVLCANCLSGGVEISNGARRILMKLPRTKFESIALLAEHPNWPEAARLSRKVIENRMPVSGKFYPPLQ